MMSLMGVPSPINEAILNETKSQSLQHIQADGFDFAANDLEIMSSPKSAKFWQESAVKHLRFKADKLRQQSTNNGSDGDE